MLSLKEFPIGLDMTLTARRDAGDDGEEIHYWRKANQVHNWIIRNCAEGKDDCEPVVVPLAKLMELRAICFELVKSDGDRELAAKLLPTMEGFFFGSTDYDEGYWYDVEDTLDILDQIANATEVREYVYQASW